MRTIRATATAAIALTFTLTFAAAPTSLLGSWRLSEQYYEDGQHNFHGPEDELVVSFRVEAGTFAGMLAWNGHSVPWPAYPGPDGPVTIEQVEMTHAPDLSAATVGYRVLPAPGDDTVLIVEERWRTEGPDRLLCELQLRFERHGEIKGGFTWNRVFVRVMP